MYHVIPFRYLSEDRATTTTTTKPLTLPYHPPSPKQTKKEQKRTFKMPMTSQARSAYRALLREHPRRNLRATSTTPLHNRLRELFRRGLPTNTTTTIPSAESADASAHAEARTQRVQEAEQIAQYARAQRMYAHLLDLYNPGMSMDEEEKIRLTARRVGWELPVEAGK